MQRLFSIFPNGWPGVGLLLLRFAIGLPLVADSTLYIFGWSHDNGLAIELAKLCAGLMLVFGLCTPFAAVAQVVLIVANSFARDRVDGLTGGIIGLSLLMLGPGAWSADARLFGRQKIDLSQK
jgi:putative oxidoreductase